MVNQADKPIRDSVVDVSPAMYPPALMQPGWYRQRNAAGDLVAPILDDQHAGRAERRASTSTFAAIAS
jgi:hypothetical protein